MWYIYISWLLIHLESRDRYQMIPLTMLDNHVIRHKCQTEILMRILYIRKNNHRKMEYISIIAYISLTKSPKELKELKLVSND